MTLPHPLITAINPRLRPFDLQSESYQPTGSISADGIRNQLGRPKLDRLTLLVRESVQNSWDAKISSHGGVRYGMAGYELSDRQREWLTRTMFKKIPSAGLELKSLLGSSEPATVLALYDRGTIGLCGPTRADQESPDVPANFINLLRNVGQPPTAIGGGGTYGFGKTALFLASRARTIVAHTQIASGRRFEQRLIATALGSQYTHRALGRHHRYTGRHWWGRKVGSVVEPFTGRDAMDAAKMLGLPLFEKGETGTTILVLLPDFEERSPEDALRFIAEAILRNFWPKMVDGSRGAGTMAFELSWNGIAIPIPRPQDVPPLGAYVKAFHNLQARLANRRLPHSDGWLQEIHSQRPQQHLGTLSLVRFPPEPRLGSSSQEDTDGPFTSQSHHTALMRAPRFVVSYLEGPTMPYELAEYSGVFVATAEAEKAFSRSEPPTHDDWIPDMLDDRHERTYVRVGLKRIREGMQEFAGVGSPGEIRGESVPLGGFSDLLGGLLPAERGTGTRGGVFGNGETVVGGGKAGEREEGGRRRTSSMARVRITEAGDPRSIKGSKVPVFTVGFVVEPHPRKESVVVSAHVAVLLEDGSIEGDPPTGSERPKVLSWTNAKGKNLGDANTLEISPDDAGPWTIRVAMLEDAAVVVELDIEGAA